MNVHLRVKSEYHCIIDQIEDSIFEYFFAPNVISRINKVEAFWSNRLSDETVIKKKKWNQQNSQFLNLLCFNDSSINRLTQWERNSYNFESVKPVTG